MAYFKEAIHEAYLKEVYFVRNREANLLEEDLMDHN